MQTRGALNALNGLWHDGVEPKISRFVDGVRRRVGPRSASEKNGFHFRETSFEFRGFTGEDVKRFREATAQIHFSRRRLRVRIYEHALLSPLRPRADGSMLGGVFDCRGTPVREAQIQRAGEGLVVGSELTEDKAEPHVLEEAIYGGAVFSGFGHILLESACRLWAAERFPQVPILFQSFPGNDSSERTLLDLARLFGISVERIRFATDNTRVARLMVPEPGLTLGQEIRSEYLEFVQRRPKEPTAQADAAKRVFLSRAGLNWRQRRAVGEQDLEKTLSLSGTNVVRPETLPLAGQVAIYEQAASLVGFIGSQFHSLFLRRSTNPIDILYLCSSNPNVNFFQIDLLFPGRRIYGNVALYDPAFEFGNRSPFYFSGDQVRDLLCEIGVRAGNIEEPDTSIFVYEWALAFFYFKVFRQGLLSGEFTKVADLRLKKLVRGFSRKLNEDERTQVLKAYRECARRYKNSDNAEVLAGAELLATLLEEHGATSSEDQ